MKEILSNIITACEFVKTNLAANWDDHKALYKMAYKIIEQKLVTMDDVNAVTDSQIKQYFPDYDAIP